MCPFDPGLNHAPPDIQQTAVAYAGWTSGFTAPARQATIEMELGCRGGYDALQDLFDQINATARPVQFIAEKLIGGARCRAEAAVHTFAQDRIRFFTFIRMTDEAGEVRLHQFSGWWPVAHPGNVRGPR